MTSTDRAPKTAMVLAAGLGLRMRPLTLERPKPLIEIAGRTMLDYALDRLQDAGVETAVVNTHYLGEMIAAHLRGRAKPEITLSPEERPLETGGGIRHALPLLGDVPFFTVNADIVWLDGPRSALREMIQQWDPERMDALLLLTPSVLAIGYDGIGDFFIEQDGSVRRRIEQEIAPYVYAGVQIVKPELYRDPTLPEGPFSNNRIWDKVQENGRLFGVRHDGLWFHVGTPQALQEAEEIIDRGRLRWIDK
jgi:N-acetyl-alpha-D-muramate 1-phosphate uridylyltransferase